MAKKDMKVYGRIRQYWCDHLWLQAAVGCVLVLLGHILLPGNPF